MPHFFISSTDFKGNKIVISDKDNYNHIAKSLRTKKGEKLLLIDENQVQYETVVEEITNKEIKLWERIFVRAVETKEIRSDVNPSILALTFRILLFGKCFQDALVNGLRIEELKAVLYNQYELIKN